MSMVDGFPYKEEVGGSSPSAPTSKRFRIWDFGLRILWKISDLKSKIENSFSRSRSSVG